MPDNLCNEFIRHFGHPRRGISERAAISGAPAVALPYFAAALKRYGKPDSDLHEIRFTSEFPEALKQECGVRGSLDNEAFAIRIDGGRIEIHAPGELGRFHGAMEVLRMLEQPDIHDRLVYASPLVKLRGLKIYLPAPDEAGFAAFRKLVDFLARYRYNFLMIEIGGAMEFKSHPEINQGWLEYCKFMNEYSGKPQKIQHSFDWNKNSIHTTNGGGKVLTQKQVKEMISYCRERFIEVVPEMPSLSHCDYLLTRHPELAERPEDPYPDTVCPNHPDYYPLLFDLFDEIIEVFRPKRMHIGHDEYYSIALCPRCKGLDAAEIYAADIKRCSEFLKSRGVATMIWGEKLLDAKFKNGVNCGGSELAVWHAPDNGIKTPATHRAIDLVPEDLQIMHWYWGIDRNFEQRYIEKNFPMMFGNFESSCAPDWKKRRQHPNLLGCSISNWGATDFKTLQRNGILFELLYTAAMCWNSKLDSADYPLIRDFTLAELYRLRHALEPARGRIEVVHTTTEKRPHVLFFDGWFVDETRDLLGHHLFRTEEGPVLELPVIYGGNISSATASLERGVLSYGDFEYDGHKPDMNLIEPNYESLPEWGADRKIYYRTSYPTTGKHRRLEYLAFRPAPGFAGHVELRKFEWKGPDDFC